MKNIVEYISCVLLALIFGHYLNGRGGFLIAVVMIIGAVLSIALSLYVRKKITLSLTGSGVSYFGKGDTAEIAVTVSKSTRLPTPFIELTVTASENLELDENDSRIRLTLVNRPSEVVTKQLRAIGCGGGAIAVSEAYICDFLGFLRLKLPLPEGHLTVGVLPDIVEIIPDRELLRSAVDTDSEDEDEEKESAATTYTFNGTAGYEHRSYIPGDPLKKVNWKLSSKRDELLVRLDEQLVSSSRVFVLDLSPQGFGVQARDRIIQSCFAVVLYMIRSGYECELYFYGGEPRHIKLTPQDDPQQLQTLMALSSPVPESAERIPEEAFTDGRGATVFTDERRAEFFLDLSARTPEGGACFITYGLSAPLTANMWTVDAEGTFHKI